jgi:hypothetical protein
VAVEIRLEAMYVMIIVTPTTTAKTANAVPLTDAM